MLQWAYLLTDTVYGKLSDSRHRVTTEKVNIPRHNKYFACVIFTSQRACSKVCGEAGVYSCTSSLSLLQLMTSVCITYGCFVI